MLGNKWIAAMLGAAAMLISLGALAQASDAGPKRGKRRRSASEKFWKELHEGFANATLLLVLLHVAGAFLSSLVHRENLVKAMWTEMKQNAEASALAGGGVRLAAAALAELQGK